MRLLKTLILVCFILLSCNKLVDIEMPEHKPQLVLHGYVTTGDYFAVSIGKTMAVSNYMDYQQTFVDNAWVVLYEEDNFRDTLRYDAQKKKYASQTVKAEPGKTYTVRAGADGFTTIEATATATRPVNTVEIVHTRNARSTSFGETLDEITFSFQDPGNENNFYLVLLNESLWSHQTVFCIYSADPAIERIETDALPTEFVNRCIDRDEVIFSDKSFNGMLKQLSLSSPSNALKTMADTTGRLHRPYFKRYSISEEYFLYLKATISLGSYEELPVQREPILLKGNVRNGYGLFAVSAVVTDTLR